MAEKKVTLTLDGETYVRVAGRAASDDCTIQNVVVAACREFIGERQRNRVGHVGGRPETLRGGPVEAAAEGHGPRTLEMRIGRNTCLELETRAARDGLTLHSVIVRAVKAWVGRSTASRTPAPSPPASAPPAPQEPAAQPPQTEHGQVTSRKNQTAQPPAVAAFVTAARRHLEPILQRSGNLLYSGIETLRPGPVYLLGLNPGGDPEDPILRAQTIGSTLDALAAKHKNEWLDVSWREQGTRRRPGQALLQRRVRALLEGLGLDPRDVCAANLIFARSRNAADSGFQQLAPICWRVHEEILRIVQPRLIVAFGNSGISPYGYLLTRFAPRSEETFPSGHGEWQCRAFNAGGYRIVGLPHLSRYAVDRHPEVAVWLRHLLSDL